MKQFKVTSGDLFISDPCYTTDNWRCNLVRNVANGLWMSDAKIDENSGRVASIHIYNNAAFIRNTNLIDEVYNAPEMPFLVCVDSGQAGFFDANHYREDLHLTGVIPICEHDEIKKEGDIFFSACAYITLDEAKTGERFGSLPFGFVARSGYGDGSYKCLGIKETGTNQYIAFTILFIENSFNEDNDFETDEDEEDTED